MGRTTYGRLRSYGVAGRIFPLFGKPLFRARWQSGGFGDRMEPTMPSKLEGNLMQSRDRSSGKPARHRADFVTRAAPSVELMPDSKLRK
jgi:hypothetical protein